MNQTSKVIQHLRRSVLLHDGAGLTDGKLLECFIEHRDEAAFAALVKRYGPMVWGVCHRLLNHHDAEDAFQATFLVLVRKAASIKPREMVGNWLYGVAHQMALQARRTATRRRAKEKQVREMPDAKAEQQDLWDDLRPLLDQALSHLPDKYRAVIVLCDLEGKTRKETAQQLGCPEGTVAGRLARARSILAKRLTRHGLAMSSGALAAMLTEKAASACVPTSALSSTIQGASLFATGQAATTGAISIQAVALTEGVLKTMLMSKLKAALAVALVLGLMATGATVLTGRMATEKDDKPPITGEYVIKPQKQEKGGIAWGEEIDGLQAGLDILPNEHRTYHHGQTITLVVRVRNVGKQTVKFEYIRQFLDENSPVVTDAEGKTVPQVRYGVTGLVHPAVEVSLAPGQEIQLESRVGGKSGAKRELKPASDREKPSKGKYPPLYATGKVSLQYERVFGNTSIGQIQLDPKISKLATGKLEIDIKPDPPSPASASNKALIDSNKSGVKALEAKGGQKPRRIKYEDFVELNHAGGGAAATGIRGKGGFTVVPLKSVNGRSTFVISFSVKEAELAEEPDFQVVAVDGNGKRHEAKPMSVSAGGNGLAVVTLVPEFDLASDNIKSFVIQRRARYEDFVELGHGIEDIAAAGLGDKGGFIIVELKMKGDEGSSTFAISFAVKDSEPNRQIDLWPEHDEPDYQVVAVDHKGKRHQAQLGGMGGTAAGNGARVVTLLPAFDLKSEDIESFVIQRRIK